MSTTKRTPIGKRCSRTSSDTIVDHDKRGNFVQMYIDGLLHYLWLQIPNRTERADRNPEESPESNAKPNIARETR